MNIHTKTRRSLSALGITLLMIALVSCSATNPGGASTSQNQQGNVNNTAINGCNEGATPFGGGTGSASSPFLLCSSLHIQSLQTTSSIGANFLMVADIDMTNANIFAMTSFTGVFDGGNHSIFNLTAYTPLFNTSTGTVKNLNLQNVNISGGTRGASLMYTNGLGGQVTNCSATGVIAASYMPGGLIGVNQGTVTNSWTNIAITAYDHVGGLVGVNLGTITHSHAIGPVKSQSDYTGGLVGQNNSGTINTSYATGQVSGHNSAGGLVGDNSGGTIQNNFANSAVSGVTGVGGLIGTNNGTVTDCFSSGGVVGTTTIGGMVGGQTGGSVTSSYWDTQTSGQSASAAGVGNLTAAMLSQGTYVSWDFTSTWQFAAGKYPSLR